MLLIAGLATMASARSLDGPSHTFTLRYRGGFVPDAIIDNWYYDTGDEGALGYARPNVRGRSWAFEYTLGVMKSANFSVWAGRLSVPLEPGYWDDKEKPPETPVHTDGDWVEVDGLGAWTLGASYTYIIPIFDLEQAPLELGFGIGGGFGVGLGSGTSQVWKPSGNPDVVDPTCGVDDIAPERQQQGCVPDTTIEIPSAIPVLDLTIGPRLVIADHVVVEIEGGFFNIFYLGGAVGATF